ncbi:MAG: hypothetical protein Q8M16_02130 [Pirellulaceae bacterium]|nr:hypothetical protein [Pirellulaceae bacterium]
MVRRTYTKRLLVEGREEQRLIPQLIEHNSIVWGETREQAIVDIAEFDGVDNLLRPGVIETELKVSGLRELGIIVDADEDLDSRWQAVRRRCLQEFSSQLPKQLSENGLVIENQAGLRLGVWIMPDNKNQGMLETFLSCLVPENESEVYQHAVHCVSTAKERGAPFLESQRAKALIHTWLGWQNPPGRQLHQAIIERILIPHSERSKPFVDWFRKLFRV